MLNALRRWNRCRFFEYLDKRRATSVHLGIEALEDRLTPAPTITGLQAPGSVRPFLGEEAVYSFNFTNQTSLNGFSPYITVFVDSSGADFTSPGGTGTPDGFGVPVVRASGLLTPPAGAPVVIGPGQTTYTNPFTGQAGLLIPAGFGEGDTIYVYRLPFGSFTPGQTTQVTITIPTSNLADLNDPLELAIIGGYRDGENSGPSPIPGANPVESAPVFTDATPRLYELRKIYLGPENETATGPNYVRRYRLEIDIATGQTLTNLVLTDQLAPSMQIVGRNTNVVANQPFGTSGQPNMAVFLAPNLTTNVFNLVNLSGTAVDTTPGGTLIYNFGTVTGVAGVDAVFEFNFWVPRDFANPPGGQVLPQNATSGTNSIIQQN